MNLDTINYLVIAIMCALYLVVKGQSKIQDGGQP